MNAPLRRGACPRLSAPMATGDGLLARIVPSGRTIGLDAFAGLCVAARSCGNGIVEITSRGSIQVRGLSPASVPEFIAAVDALGIDCGDDIPVLIHPLSGLDPAEVCDVGPLADALRRQLAARPVASRLSAKVSVIVDGGGALHLDEVGADIRLRAIGGDGRCAFHVGLGGSAAAAMPLGAVSPEHAVECVLRLLDVLADIAPRGRARAVIESGQGDAFRNAVADLIVAGPPPMPRQPVQSIGLHSLRIGAAMGIGLPFGHANVGMLDALVDAARRAGASGLRTAPDRTLLVLGLVPVAAVALRQAVGSLGFVVDAGDARRSVIACAGAPVCAAGQIPTRSLAPAVASAVSGRLAGRGLVHLSGCSKGCAHPGPAAIDVFGRDGICDIRRDGGPVVSVTADHLPAQIARMLQSRQEPTRG